MGDRFGKGGIADRMIWFNGFPFLDNKEEHTFNVPVSQVMTGDVTVLPASGLQLQAVEKLLSETRFQGFPVVEDRTSMVLLGYIGRTELRYAIDRAKKEGIISSVARCFFTPPLSAAVQTPLAAVPPVTFDDIASLSGQHLLDFSRFIDSTPLAVHPRLPLETVMEIFKKMGPRVILIEYRGRLTGLVTVKDCLKYQFKVEAQENPRDDSTFDERQERLWAMINKAGDWVADKVLSVSGGRIKLGGRGLRVGQWNEDPRDHRSPIEPSPSDRILDGTEDDDLGLELEER